MRTDPLRELERRVAIDPADLNTIQQLVNVSLRVGWTHRNKSLKLWTKAVDGFLDFRMDDLGPLGLRLIPKFVEVIESGRSDGLIFVTRQLSRMGSYARAAIPSLVNALSKNLNRTTDLHIMRCLGDIGCDHDLVELGVALSCESNNSRLHFEALKTVIKIDPKRFLENYEDLIRLRAQASAVPSSKTLDDDLFNNLMDSYESAPYWGRRFQDLQSILRHGQDAHLERARDRLKAFFVSNPSPWLRNSMLQSLAPVAREVLDVLPQLISCHCEVWAREQSANRRQPQEGPRDRILPLLKKSGPPAIEHVLRYVDGLMERLQKARDYSEERDIRAFAQEAFRLLEAFDVHLIPVMVRTFELRKKGFNLRRLAQMRASEIAPDTVIEAVVMALVVQALSGSQKTRAYAIECLGLYRTQEGIAGPAMAVIIKEEQDGKARRRAIEALRNMDRVARTAFVNLLESIQNSDGGHRIRMATAIVELGWVNHGVLSTFGEILRSPVEKKSAKRQICELIKRIGPGALILRPELEALSKNFNVSLRSAAENALKSLTAPERRD